MNKVFLLLCLLLANQIQAEVTLASLFSDNMVLQRDAKIPIWGWASSEEKITVLFHNQQKSITADQSGKWIVYLDKEEAGGPFTLVVKGENTLQINNILVGEVWICSGQSNMEWIVGQSDNAENEIASANYPTIRHIKIPKAINSLPSSKFATTTWEVCSPKTVENFTAVGYYYAKELNQQLQVPIGLINATWGGTNIETWMSKEGFETDAEFKEVIQTMPQINIDSLLKVKIESNKREIESIQKAALNPEKASAFNRFDFDDSQWPTLQQPGFWEQQQLVNLDGVVWLRKEFIIKKVNGPITLEIPAIDDNDVTYVNGVKIGETNGWDIKRVYQIPAEILKKGKNSIAIRVEDNGSGGGIHGLESELKIIQKKTIIPLNGKWKFQVESIKDKLNENDFPSLCYNAMIQPLVPFAFKGVIWYQGESNASRAYQYRKAFPLLIQDWRQKWQNDFPFYFVQLATFKTPGNSNEGCEWAELREAQSQTLSIKNTGMIVTTDIGNPTDIHPRNKTTVGKRLAAVALTNSYQKNIYNTGPTFHSFQKKDNELLITFDFIGKGLSTTNEYGLVNGFEVAGENQTFYIAKAYIKDNKLVVSCDEVPNPIAVRFGWKGDASHCNLFNEEGFPAVPFRSDDWKPITKNEKYKIRIN